MKVAVVGATGVVGETILRVLEERGIGNGSVGRFASRDRDGIRAATDETLGEYDVVFFASGEDASVRYVPALAARGAFAIDNSSSYRMQAGVPLIVPEVNADAARPEHRIYPVANCTAIVLCVALAPVRDVAGLRSVRVATYQAASGAGRAGLEELLAGERAIASGEAEPANTAFPARLARNVVPQVGTFDDDGFSGEERKVAEETRKMLGLPELNVMATTVRVPVRTAHSEAIFIETERDTSVEELGRAFERAPGVVFHRTGIVTPREVEGTDHVHVARLRAEEGSGRNFALWAVGDQLRKGAATNAVQILQLLTSKGYIGA
ncbi:MAG: aspartate-semialdehyde dehydrogenase [Candidatus Eremiobacteraeota bacterium]|nr:aspartate-semialdehyde dehydrogenase [Candidatus Eremiobacteraeota bacterium]